MRGVGKSGDAKWAGLRRDVALHPGTGSREEPRVVVGLRVAMSISKSLRHLSTAVLVLFVAALFLTLLVPGQIGGGASKEGLERSELRALIMSSKILISMYGREPRHVEPLLELLRMWRDRWGQEIRAEFRDTSVVLTSAGPDGEFGTLDDIVASR
jgi:hypothetical protein